MIRFEHVTKRYEDKDALSGANLEIRDTVKIFLV